MKAGEDDLTKCFRTKTYRLSTVLYLGRRLELLAWNLLRGPGTLIFPLLKSYYTYHSLISEIPRNSTRMHNVRAVA